MKRRTRLALIGAATAAVVTIGGIGIATADDVAAGKNPLSNLLSKLVTDGTITQNQADAITEAMDEERAAHDAERTAHEQARQDAITKTLGLEWSAIQTRLQNGETLAAIAGENKDALIKALVAVESKHIDEHVTDGRLTEAQATEMKASLTERVTAMVEGTRGPGFGHRDGDDEDFDGRDHGPGHGPEHGPGHGPGHHGGGFGFGPMGTPGGSDSGSDA